MEDIILLDGCETTIDNVGKGHVVGIMNGERFEIGIIDNAFDLPAHELHERAKLLLDREGFAVKPNTEAPRTKRKYTRRVNLGLASDYGKVTLKVVEKEKKVITFYNLYIKGTKDYVYKLDEKGIYVTNGKTKPMAFTQADIKCIRNINDFDLVKVTKETSYIKNKIAK